MSDTKSPSQMPEQRIWVTLTGRLEVMERAAHDFLAAKEASRTMISLLEDDPDAATDGPRNRIDTVDRLLEINRESAQHA